MRYQNLCLISLCLLLANEAATPSESFDLRSPIPEQLAAYSRAAKLGPLGSKGVELRVWIDNVMLASLQGFAIANTGLSECETSYTLKDRVVTVKPAKCKPTGTPDRGRRALAQLHDLSKLDGKELGCGAVDGADIYVEGTTSGRRFAFIAGNPDSCTDAGSRLSKVLHEFGESASGPQRRDDPKFPAQTANAVYAIRQRGAPGRTNPMYALQRLLFDRLHSHWNDIAGF
jgi:hypothetical protein